MKIKLDFITNSSSTSYIVYVPKDFNIEKFLHLARDYDESQIEAYDTTKEKLKQSSIKLMNELLKNGCIDEYENVLEFTIIIQVLRKLDLIIVDMDTSSSGDGLVFDVNNEKYIEKIKTIKSGGWGVLHGGWGQKV